MSTGQGSGGNVLAAICSLFIPGLGQLVQGRLLMAVLMFVLAGVLWFSCGVGSSISGRSSTLLCSRPNPELT
jgi:TM2 domain-containing membrane protein YozV